MGRRNTQRPFRSSKNRWGYNPGEARATKRGAEYDPVAPTPRKCRTCDNTAKQSGDQCGACLQQATESRTVQSEPKPPRMNERCRDFSAIQEELASRARDLGIEMKVNTVSCSGDTMMLHVMFDRGGRRVLEYWPSNGKAWDKRNGRKLTIATGWLALDEAAGLDSEKEAAAPAMDPLHRENLDLAGRCVKCLEEAPKRFDGLCAFCYTRSL